MCCLLENKSDSVFVFVSVILLIDNVSHVTCLSLFWYYHPVQFALGFICVHSITMAHTTWRLAYVFHFFEMKNC